MSPRILQLEWYVCKQIAIEFAVYTVSTSCHYHRHKMKQDREPLRRPLQVFARRKCGKLVPRSDIYEACGVPIGALNQIHDHTWAITLYLPPVYCSKLYRKHQSRVISSTLAVYCRCRCSSPSEGRLAA